MQPELVLPPSFPIALLKVPSLHTSLLLQLSFALLEETLLLLPALSILRGTLLLHSLLPALPVGVVSIVARPTPAIGLLSLLVLPLLVFKSTPLVVRLALTIISGAVSPLCFLLALAFLFEAQTFLGLPLSVILALLFIPAPTVLTLFFVASLSLALLTLLLVGFAPLRLCLTLAFVLALGVGLAALFLTTPLLRLTLLF